jgi:arylsulfatase A-like enzyme
MGPLKADRKMKTHLRVTRKQVLAAALGWLGVAALGQAAQVAAAPKAARPNIIFILSDDYGIAGTGCYGAVYRTPNLDTLAAAGTRFENCFSAPLCGPSRAMCMFGRYGFRTGVTDNGSGAAATPQKEVCIAKVLKQAGYATAVAGKWTQLRYFDTKEDGQKWGFDEFLIWGIAEEGGGRARYWSPNYNQNGRYLTDAKDKFGPDLLQEFVVDFIRRHRDQPFFIYYPTPLIHGKLARTPDSVGSKADLYADNILYMDKLVGKLVAELERLKLRENTLIVFTGDNGCVGQQTVNGRPIDGKKGALKEGGSRVPLIVNWPGTTPAGKLSKDLVDFSDFFPTFAEVAKADLPPGVTLDGHSFAPQILGQPGQPRDWVYVQLHADRYVRDAQWKLTKAGDLFDMKDAPWREIPVPSDTPDAGAKAARARLKTVLDGLLAQDTGQVAIMAEEAKEARKQDKRAKKRKQRQAVP